MYRLTRLLFAITVALACISVAYAEESVLVVQVVDTGNRPFVGIVLSATGDSSTGPPTDVAGKTRIKLASQTRPGSEVEMIIVRAPQDLVFISPWNQRITVPCFENDARCVAKVVLAVIGSRELLMNSQTQLAMVLRVNAANASKISIEPMTEEQRLANLAEVAKAFGYTPDEIDQAIRSLRKTTIDPYQLGQIALYEKNYAEAERQLLRSKTERKDKLADVSSSLGQTYYEQGKFREAVQEFREADSLRPNDIDTLNNIGTSLHLAGQYAEAEPLLKRALMLTAGQSRVENLGAARILTNLAALYIDQGKYTEAEPLLKRGLTIREKQLGVEHPDVATSLNNLAALYRYQGKYLEAEPLFKRALAIVEKQLGIKPLYVVTTLSNLAVIYSAQGKYADAEQTYKRALDISEKYLGAEHPNVATCLNNLAVLYLGQGRYAEAEPLLKRTLMLREKQLGSNHRDVANSLANLAVLYIDQGKDAEAEPLLKRALMIVEKSLGSEHPYVATILEIYVVLLRATNRMSEAEQMETRAKAIRAKQK